MSTPLELYRFVIDADVYTYTSGDTDVDYNGETYAASPLKRSDMEQGQDINRANIKVSLPRTNPIAALYLGQIPDWQASVTLFRQTGATTLTYWKGRIVSVSASNNEVTLDCDSAFTTLKRPGLRRRYQVPCPYGVYHRGCRLDLETWGVPMQITAYTDLTLTVPDAAAFDNGYFTGGIARDPWGVMRWITSHNNGAITLARMFNTIGEDIAAAGYGYSYGSFYGAYGAVFFPGCDRTKETCDTKFGNIDNFGGFAWIPNRNPFDGSSIV